MPCVGVQGITTMPGTLELNKHERTDELPSGTHTLSCVFLTVVHPPPLLDLLDTPEPTWRIEALTGRGVWHKAGLGLNRGFDIHMRPGYE